MNTKVKAVLDLMNTLGVSLQDLTGVKAVIDLMNTLGVSLQDLAGENPAQTAKSAHKAPQAEQTSKQASASQSVTKETEAPKAPKENKNKAEKPNNTEFQRCQTANGFTYVKHGKEVIGLLLSGFDTGEFVLSMKNIGGNRALIEARIMAQSIPLVQGKEWIVPSDEHFMVIRNKGIDAVNRALKDIGADTISSSQGYLSTTSQANRPSAWYTRFVCPLA